MSRLQLFEFLFALFFEAM